MSCLSLQNGVCFLVGAQKYCYPMVFKSEELVKSDNFTSS